VHIYLWDDATATRLNRQAPQHPLEERLYFIESIRYVEAVTIVSDLANRHTLPDDAVLNPGTTWAVSPDQHTSAKDAYCQKKKLGYRVLFDLAAPSATPPQIDGEAESAGSRKKVLVTGCFDWLHTGHVRFFEEVSELGALYVVVGHDKNIRELKGEGHPLFPEEERRYLVGSVRFVTQALVSTGHGWLDAEPEIRRIRPDIYALNEEGDKPVKRQYCEANGIKYVVLKRQPKAGLLKRESTKLRGF